MKGFRAKDAYDVEAEMSAVFIRRHALGRADEARSPFEHLLDEEN